MQAYRRDVPNAMLPKLQTAEDVIAFFLSPPAPTSDVLFPTLDKVTP